MKKKIHLMKKEFQYDLIRIQIVLILAGLLILIVGISKCPI
jgi:hypothetical protein